MTEFVPHGYISVHEAVNRLGRELFPEAWTGEEYEARSGLISEEEWLKKKDLASARGGGAPGSAPIPKTIAAPVATALHPTGDPSRSSSRGGGAPGSAPIPKTIAAPAATGPHRTGDPAYSAQSEYRLARGQEIPRAEPVHQATTQVKIRGSDRCLAGKSSDRKSNAARPEGFRAQEVPEFPGD
jgi:hypothetical protein